MNCENIDRTKVAANLGVVVAVAVLPLLVAASYKRVGCVPTRPSGWKDIGDNCFDFALLVDRPWTALSEEGTARISLQRGRKIPFKKMRARCFLITLDGGYVDTTPNHKPQQQQQLPPRS